jgi:Dynamin family
MFGAFSSGKSFLLSGLQGGLDVIEVDTGEAFKAEKFVGLLPSSPQPTTPCPASVIPVEESGSFDTSGRGYLRVRFADADDWEDIGASPAPAVLAAYAMAEADVSNRLPPHWNREVAEIEILLSDFKLPAKLYDLPGYGSPNPIHDNIVKTAMNEADCFIYVSHASRTLSENDLELIRALYAHCQAWKKRVIWVLTAVDTATQLDHRHVAAWRTVIDRNNAYLKENFTEYGEPDASFFGEGFIPVSPAAEARAALSATAGDMAIANRHLAASKMETLRRILGDLIDQETGLKHIADVAAAALSLVGPWSRAVSERLQAERLPFDELAGLMASQRERLDKVDSAIRHLRGELENGLDSHVKRAIRPFDRLAAHLHAELDATIRSTDVRNTRKANEVQVTKAQVMYRWLSGPDGPAAMWDARRAQYKQDLLNAVQRRLGERDPAGLLPDYQLDVDSLELPSRQQRPTRQDIVQRAAVVVGVAAPVAATAGWLAGTIAAGVAFPPAAAVAGAAALVYMGVQVIKGRATSLQVMQQEWISGLNDEARHVQEQFRLAIAAQGLNMIDNLEDNLRQYAEQLDEALKSTEERLSAPEHQTRQEAVDELVRVGEQGERLKAALEMLVAPSAGYRS